MSFAITTGSPFDRTPYLSGVRERSTVAPEDSWWESTPVSVRQTSPDFGSMIRTFSEALDLVQDKDFIRFVTGAGSSGILTSSLARTTLPLKVLQFGAVTGQMSSLAPDVVSVFRQIQQDLGVTQDDMFAATGIKHRTFHSWKRKPSSSRPRLDSVGRLWRLDDLLGELRETLDVPVGHWLKSSPERLARFRAGDLDGLLDLASGVDSATTIKNVLTYSTGLGVDIDVPIVKSGTRRIASVDFRTTK